MSTMSRTEWGILRILSTVFLLDFFNFHAQSFWYILIFAVGINFILDFIRMIGHSFEGVNND